ncbi:MAG: YggS family pyridoxal phosphate-dependent enzyme [Myxococcota bacterium]|nr:YggS family pyridoxal phosphate-dependent enzyme [Myxococcota bacterium]
MPVLSSLPIILASASPRRLALLEGAGLRPRVEPAHIDETPLRAEQPRVFAERMAIEKADAIARTVSRACVIAGDTVVALGDEILGKPRDVEDAAHMLRRLSGQAHQVFSGWAVCDGAGRRVSGVAVSDVTFTDLSEGDIASYVASGEPMDKAGAYGIQGEGGRLVQRYTGDYSNIVGLPLADVLGALAHLDQFSRSPLAQKLAMIRGRVAVAAHESGRSPESVEVIAASKGQSLDRMRALRSAGVTSFGESYVSELLVKRPIFDSDTRVHFIGHLQRNKVRKLIPGVVSVQTVDSVRLGEEIGKRARMAQLELPILVQVNLGGEETKSGCAIDDLESLLNALRSIDGLCPVGLMAIPPRAGLASTRSWFRTLKDLRDSVATDESPIKHLSMGMSADFDAAIIEGATMIRLGTLLCGPRS